MSSRDCCTGRFDRGKSLVVLTSMEEDGRKVHGNVKRFGR